MKIIVDMGQDISVQVQPDGDDPVSIETIVAGLEFAKQISMAEWMKALQQRNATPAPEEVPDGE